MRVSLRWETWTTDPRATSCSRAATRVRRWRTCCHGCPAGYRVIVVDNGSQRRHRRGRPAPRRHGRRPSAGPGTAPRCTRDSRRPRPSTSRSWTATAPSTPPTWRRCSTTSASGRADLAVGPASPGHVAASGPGTPAPATRWSSALAAPPDRPAAPRHRTDAGLPAPGAAGPRRPGPRASATRSSCCSGPWRRGWRFAEHDVTYHPRAAGTRSKVSGSVTGTLRAARDFARVLCDDRPGRWSSPRRPSPAS